MSFLCFDKQEGKSIFSMFACCTDDKPPTAPNAFTERQEPQRRFYAAARSTRFPEKKSLRFSEPAGYSEPAPESESPSKALPRTNPVTDTGPVSTARMQRRNSIEGRVDVVAKELKERVVQLRILKQMHAEGKKVSDLELNEVQNSISHLKVVQNLMMDGSAIDRPQQQRSSQRRNSALFADPKPKHEEPEDQRTVGMFMSRKSVTDASATGSTGRRNSMTASSGRRKSVDHGSAGQRRSSKELVDGGLPRRYSKELVGGGLSRRSSKELVGGGSHLAEV